MSENSDIKGELNIEISLSVSLGWSYKSIENVVKEEWEFRGKKAYYTFKE